MAPLPVTRRRLGIYSVVRGQSLRTFSFGQFEYDAPRDRLPVVSWLIPTSYQSEHPDYTPAAYARPKVPADRPFWVMKVLAKSGLSAVTGPGGWTGC